MIKLVNQKQAKRVAYNLTKTIHKNCQYHRDHIYVVKYTYMKDCVLVEFRKSMKWGVYTDWSLFEIRKLDYIIRGFAEKYPESFSTTFCPCGYSEQTGKMDIGLCMKVFIYHLNQN